MFPFLPTKVVSGRCRLWCDPTWIVVRSEANPMAVWLSRYEHRQRKKRCSRRESDLDFLVQSHDSLLSSEIQQLRGVPSLRNSFVIRYRVELDLQT